MLVRRQRRPGVPVQNQENWAPARRVPASWLPICGGRGMQSPLSEGDQLSLLTTVDPFRNNAVTIGVVSRATIRILGFARLEVNGSKQS